MPPFGGKPDVEELRAKKDIKGLIEALQYDDYYVTREAAAALGEIGLPALNSLLEPPTGFDTNRVNFDAAVVNALAAIGEPAVQPLMARLSDADARLRAKVASALGRIRDVRPVDLLCQTLKDRDESVARRAAEALGAIGDSRAVDPLIAALRDGSDWLRTGVADSLGKLGDRRAVPALLQALTDRTRDVRSAAMNALATIGDPTAILPLLWLLEDQNWEERNRVAAMLEKLGWQPTRDALGALYWIARAHVPSHRLDKKALEDMKEMCLEIGTPALPALLSVIDNGEFNAAHWAIDVLPSICAEVEDSVVRSRIAGFLDGISKKAPHSVMGGAAGKAYQRMLRLGGYDHDIMMRSRAQGGLPYEQVAGDLGVLSLVDFSHLLLQVRLESDSILPCLLARKVRCIACQNVVVAQEAATEGGHFVCPHCLDHWF